MMDVRNLSIKLRHWGGVIVLLSLILGCSVHDFVPVWRYCGVTITDSEDNTAVIYEGCGTSVFNIDLDSTEAYSLNIVRTDDSAPIDGDGISFICDGVDILNNHSSGGISVAKDGNTYTFSGIPSTEKTVEIILMLDDIVIGTHIVNIRKDRYISDPVDPPAEPIEIELSFDAEADNPESISISILSLEDIEGLEIYYTLDGSEPSKNSDKYSTAVDLSAVPGSAVLKAKGFASSSESDVIMLDYLKKGTEEDPVYLVYSEEGLREWAKVAKADEVQNKAPSIDCILGKDIEFSSSSDSESNWEPIGIKQPYVGAFDGRNHTISNVVINMPDSNYVGFFSWVADTASIMDVDISNAKIIGKTYVGAIVGDSQDAMIKGCSSSGNVAGENYVGGIVGYASGTRSSDGSIHSIITSCTNESTVNGTSVVGGIIGGIGRYNEYSSSNTPVDITYCSNEGSVTGSNDMVGGIAGLFMGASSSMNHNHNSGNVSGAEHVGGIAGIVAGDIESCENTGDIMADGTAGGIVGYSPTGFNIVSCINKGKVKIKETFAGGIIGNKSNSNAGEILSCMNSGPVSGESNIGGIMGWIRSGNIIDSSNSGYVSGASHIGGIVGYAENASAVVASFNNGEIIASGDYSGGILGYGDGASLDIVTCYNIAEIKGNSCVGGIAGYMNNSNNRRWNIHVYSCYNTGKISGTSLVGSIVGQSVVDGWDYVDYAGCYWFSGTAGEAGENAKATSVSTWDESILNTLNNSIPSRNDEYCYKVNNLNCNEPYIIVANEQAGV